MARPSPRMAPWEANSRPWSALSRRSVPSKRAHPRGQPGRQHSCAGSTRAEQLPIDLSEELHIAGPDQASIEYRRILGRIAAEELARSD